MNLNSVPALSAAFAAFCSLVALIFTYIQLRQLRFAHEVDLIFEFERRFEAPEMLDARRLAAKALQNRTSTQEIDTVLDFFETLGILVRRHAVDEELAWNAFSYWVLRYAALMRDHIAARRKSESDDTYWKEFEILVQSLTRVETKKRALKSSPFFPSELLAKFLTEEAAD